MFNRDKIANMLRQLRKERKLTQQTLEIVTGIDRTTISAYENGTREPTIHNIIILADYFQISLDTITCRTSKIYVNVTDISEVSLQKIHQIILKDEIKKGKYENR